MIALANQHSAKVIMSGIGQLGNKVDAGTAKILTVLYQQATDKRRDYEAAAMLHTAAERLAAGGFIEAVNSLGRATGRLGNFEDNVTKFGQAASSMQTINLGDFISAAGNASVAAHAIQSAAASNGPDVSELAHTVSQHIITTLNDEGATRRRDFTKSHEVSRIDWKHVLLTGVALGVVLSVLIIWAAVKLTQGP
ncbi:hypothetical protein [Saccharopolyspora sp. NPDC050642]|uniref:hypothetical protein n=1 Tax=Saccharopolyspora sp. NPDC050642 TaxID=3157099 RepID=UPI0033FF9A6A